MSILKFHYVNTSGTNLSVMPSVLQRRHNMLWSNPVLRQRAGIIPHRSHSLSSFSPHLGVVHILKIEPVIIHRPTATPFRHLIILVLLIPSVCELHEQRFFAAGQLRSVEYLYYLLALLLRLHPCETDTL